MKDFLIIGQGLAGTILADQLQKAGYDIMVIDHEENNSSRVAAGLYNPVTGRKMVKSWNADPLFELVEDYYQGLEDELNERFLHRKRIYRPFLSIAEQNDWEARKSDPKFSHFIYQVHRESLYPNLVNDPYGGLELKKSGYMKVSVLLDTFRDKLKAEGKYTSRSFLRKDLKIRSGSFDWQDEEFRNVVFCEGIRITENPYFQWLPFQPLKGEILTLKMDVTFDHIINRGVFLLNWEDDHYLVGSTYNWRDPWSGKTEDGKMQLKERLDQLVFTSYKVIDHRYGVRPSTQDRRPIIGEHPEIENMWIFNGLGTKGVSLAPFFAKQFLEFLVNKKGLDPSVNINRFYSLYFHSSSS